MGQLKVRKLGYALGVEIGGVDCSKPVDDATIAEIRKIWMDNVVACFPAQDLDRPQMAAFCSRFGPLDDHRFANEGQEKELPTVKLLLNKMATAGNAELKASERTGQLWHSDQSFTSHPSTATFLHAKDLPDVGGNTMFANMYAAYDSLSPAMQRLIETLEGVHDRSLDGNHKLKSPEKQAADLLAAPPIVHPVVRVHPETGRKALFVATRVRNFVGMSEEESKPLLTFLVNHATAYERVYRHAWTLGDLVMWDNRAALHVAVQDYDYNHQLRRMFRATILGPKMGYYYEPNKQMAAATA